MVNCYVSPLSRLLRQGAILVDEHKLILGVSMCERWVTI